MISYISYHIYYISYTHRSPEVTASMRWFSSRLSLMMLIQISLVMMFGNNALMTMIGIMIIANICLPIFQRHIALYWPCRLVGRWLMSPLIFLHIYRHSCLCRPFKSLPSQLFPLSQLVHSQSTRPPPSQHQQLFTKNVPNQVCKRSDGCDETRRPLSSIFSSNSEVEGQWIW